MPTNQPESVAQAGEYLYHPMHMHLHTCHQGGGSMEGHLANAAALGMRYIRFTDHDTRTGPCRHPVEGFDFSCGALSVQEADHRSYGFCPGDDGAPDCAFSPVGTTLSVTGGGGEGWEGRELVLYSDGKRHSASLLREVTLTLRFSIRTDTPADARVIFAVELSQRPPENRPAMLLFTAGSTEGLADGAGGVLPESRYCAPHTALLPLCTAAEADGYAPRNLTLPLSDMAQSLPERIGGLDNAFSTLKIRLETRRHGRLSLCMEHLGIHAALGFEPVIERQRVLAERLGAKYGIKPFVTTEISGAGQHKNCFSTSVPVIDYAAANYAVTQEQAIAHVQAHGGIFGYNHPLEAFKRMEFTDAEIPGLVAQKAQELIRERMYGAALTEIGFPEGRNRFSLSDHLALWDTLSLAGVFVTGYGDSDSHDNRIGWFDGNNFAAYVAAPREESFPVSEASFNASLRAGRVVTGDPVYLKGDIAFTTDSGHPTGSVLRVQDASPRTLRFALTHAAPGWQVRAMINGVITEEQTLHEPDAVLRFSLSPTLPVNFARVEVYTPEGRCILLTNPIYFVRTDLFTGPIPPEREYTRSRRFITRHGQVSASRYLKDEKGQDLAMYPVGEVPLSDLGREQAILLGQRLKELGFRGRILASPYLRTMETAEIIAAITDCRITPCPVIQEIMKDERVAREYCGASVAALQKRFPHLSPDAALPENWWPVQTETFEDVCARVKAGLDLLLPTLAEEEVLFVGHGGSVGAMMRYFGLPESMPHANYNCALTMTDPSGLHRSFRYSLSHIPYEKQTNNFITAEAEDAAYFTAPSPATLTLPVGLAADSSPRLLHIGDTFSRHYPYYRHLLSLVRPQVILHTGDLAEEVKAGRIPRTEYEYESKVRVLADILRSSGAQRILLVPGNNDLLPVLRRCLPFAEILAPGDTFFFAGRQVQASHALQDMTFKGYDAYFYGHSLRGETFSPERNQAGYPCRFNALWGSFVYTPQNPCGVFFRFPLPPLA